MRTDGGTQRRKGLASKSGAGLSFVLSQNGSRYGQQRLASQSPLPSPLVTSGCGCLSQEAIAPRGRPSPWRHAALLSVLAVCFRFLSSPRRRIRMFLPFRRQKPRPTQRPSVRLSLESLDGRVLPSVSVIPHTDPSSGAAALSQHSSAQPALPLAAQGNTKGAAGQIPALFKGPSATINVAQRSFKTAASIIPNQPPPPHNFFHN